MRVHLTRRHFGVHDIRDRADIPGDFADYATPAEPGNEDHDEWVISEDALLAALPDGFLPVPARAVLLGVSDDDNGGTAISGLTRFRPWAKYFDAWMLWLVFPGETGGSGSRG